VAKYLEIVPGQSLESDRRTTLYKPEIIEQEHEDMLKAGLITGFISIYVVSLIML